jgi:ATP-binding cassette, subfamily G (WHITE), member 2, SNQ2
MSTLDQVKEVPRGDSRPHTPTSDNAAARDFVGFNPRNSPHDSPALPCFGSNRGRRGSNASRISVDYFDPDGVQELRRTLTRMTTEGPETIEEIIRGQPAPEQSPQIFTTDSEESEASESTLAAQDGAFDFAKTLRDIVKKCAFTAYPRHAIY